MIAQLRRRFPLLRSADVVTVVFLSVVTIMEFILWDRLGSLAYYPFLNIAVITGIGIVVWLVSSSNKIPSILFVYHWYLIPLILLIYTQCSSIAFSLHGRDYDDLLIIFDRQLFGGNPLEWFTGIINPFLTEVLQFTYFSYYLFFVLLFFELYRRRMMTQFEEGAMVIVYGFYLSYIGYMLFPAVGPRLTLYEYQSIATDIPGIFLTPYLRAIIDSGGGITPGIDPLSTVHRDAFPSGHTQLTLTLMYLSFTYKTHIRWVLFICGSMLIISTLYLRYHYAVDVLAGMLFFIFTVWSGRKIHSRWQKAENHLAEN